MGQIVCSRSLLSTCESPQIFDPARFAQKLLIYQIHKYCLFSALLTTRLSSTLCVHLFHLFSTWSRWFDLLLKLQFDSVFRWKCSSLHEWLWLGPVERSPSMQELWNISWRRSVAHMRLTTFVRLGFALIMWSCLPLSQLSEQTPWSAVFCLLYTMWSQCVVFSNKTSDCVVTIDVFFLKSLSPFYRRAICVLEWLVISTVPLSVVECQSFHKQPGTIYS